MNGVSRRAIVRVFFVIFLPTALILVLASSWAVMSDAQHRLERLESRELTRVDTARNMLGRDLRGIVTDVRLIASCRVLRRYLEFRRRGRAQTA